MHFLNPWLLLGMLGVGVPIVVHLLNRYRYRQIDWGAMELLRRALVVRSRRLRLEDALLLALRCLAILLLALALARPTLTPAGLNWAGSQGDVGAVIALDGSLSMAHRPGVHSRFDRAADRVREVVKALRPGSPVSLVLLGDRPRVLLRNVRFDPERFEEILASAGPLPERLNLDAGLDEVQTLFNEIQAPSRECYLVSDAQATTWAQPSDRVRQVLGALGESGRVFFLPVATAEAENIALTRFELQSGLVRRGSTARYQAVVRNLGYRPREQVTVSLSVNGTSVDQRVLERLDPGQEVNVSLLARFDTEGIARLSARLGADELISDNARHAVANVRSTTRLLYAGGPMDSTDYALAALAPRPGGPLAVESVSWLDLPTRNLSDYQVVVLANVPDLPSELSQKLFHFVRQGGGLILLLGDNVQPVVFNALYKHDGKAFIPGEIVRDSAVRRSTAGWPIEVQGHPLARVLTSVPEQMVKEARVYHYFRLTLGKGSRTVLTLPGGDPLVCEKQLGQGRVVLFATACDRDWTNMVLDPAFYPMLLHEAVSYLSRQSFERPVTVSEALALEVPATARSVTVRDPTGRSITLPTVLRDGQTLAELVHAEQPGFYEVQVPDESVPLVAAVNVSAEESDVKSLHGEALEEAVPRLSQPWHRVRLIREGEDVGSAVQQSRVGRELWRLLLVLGLVVLIVESALAHRFTRRVSGS